MIAIDILNKLNAPTKAERLANDYRQKGDIDMTLFWHNASIGFKLRALDLTM